MDFSMWIQSPFDWGMLFLSAVLIGMSKTGIQGISLLAVPLMAMTFGAKPSTGLILPILCVADLVAVLYYRRIAEWKYVFKLLPTALAGFAVALLVDNAPVRDNVVSYDRLYNIIDVLDELAAETGKTVAQVALNWLLQRPTVCSLVIGASSEEQLRQNLGAVDWQLTAEQIQRLDVTSKTDKPYPYWHQDQRPELSSQVF